MLLNWYRTINLIGLMSSEKYPIVIDNGSLNLKAGFGGDDFPQSIFQNVIGRQKQRDNEVSNYFYVGEEAFNKNSTFKLSYKYPVENSTIVDFDTMEEIWNHTFINELRVNSKEYDVLLSEGSLNSKLNREKMTQIMFEKFSIPSLYIANQSVLGLYSSGRTTGTVLESGFGVTYSVPIYEGYYLPFSILRLDLAGNFLSDFLSRLVSNQKQIVGRDMRNYLDKFKEDACYIAYDFEKELESYKEKKDIERSFELPDGEVIKIGKERFLCPEALFQPHYCGMSAPGIQNLVGNSIKKTDNDIRKDLFGNIVLSGGSTLFEGIGKRLEKELRDYAPYTYQIKVFSMPERKYSTWIGGSIFSTLESFHKVTMSKKDYEESGASLIHTKCY